MATSNLLQEVFGLNDDEKLKRLLQDDCEIHGDPKQLLMLLRERHLDLTKMIAYVGKHTSDPWAKQYIEFRCTTHRKPD